MVKTSPLVRPYFLGEWHWAGVPIRFPQQQTCVWVAIETKQTKQRTNLKKEIKQSAPQFPAVKQTLEDIFVHQPERDPQNSQNIPVKKTQIVTILYNVITCDRFFDAKVNGLSNSPPPKRAPLKKPPSLNKTSVESGMNLLWNVSISYLPPSLPFNLRNIFTLFGVTTRCYG